jgi:hypothetical protein
VVLEALIASGMPAIAIIGGMAANIRLSPAHEAHRVTQTWPLSPATTPQAPSKSSPAATTPPDFT